MGFIGRAVAPAPITANDVPDLPASKITSGDIDAARLSNATFDDNKLKSNIAVLGFKTAVNGSLAKYVLKDQVVDEYTNSTGLDSGACVNNTLDSGGFSGSGIPSNSADSATTVGSDTLLTFSTAQSTTVTFSNTTSVEYLIVGGGGGGGFGNAGGGGAGGYLANGTKDLSMAGGTAYTITVGAKGTGGTAGVIGTNGGNSSIAGSGLSTLLADGGGGAGSGNTNGANGASGGGGGYNGGSGGSATGNGLGNAGGGQTTSGPNHGAGGGGGSAGAGQNGTNNNAGDGGSGTANDITGSSVTYASGGGASANNVGASINGSGGSSGAGRGIGGDGDGDITLADATVFGCGGGGVYNHSGNRGGNGAGGVVYLLFVASVTDMTLQSTDATALTAPTKADMIMLMEDVAGTATLNTDIKAFISRDSGTTFTQGTLVDEGTYETNKKIIAFHDLDISGQPSGTDICYKITTHNQSAGSKETRIHATSYGWS